MLIFIPNKIEGQPLWRQYVPQAFVNIEKEVYDSIRVFRKLSDTLRVQMNEIILSEGLDRISIVGENDQYLKEGMHKNFVRAPGRMQGHYERNMQIQILENLHVDLYHADEQLYRWLDFSAVLRKHPNRTSFCLLYTSDAANERSSVDLGGRRLIKQKKNTKHESSCEGLDSE